MSVFNLKDDELAAIAFAIGMPLAILLVYLFGGAS